MSELKKMKEEFKKSYDMTDLQPTAKAGFAIATALICVAEQFEIKKALDSIQLLGLSGPDTPTKHGGLYKYGSEIFKEFGIKPKQD